MSDWPLIPQIETPWATQPGAFTFSDFGMGASDQHKDLDKKALKKALKATREQIEPHQRALYAGKQYSVLAIFQALDAAGKDGSIREVFFGIDPAGIEVSAFKKPTDLELRHDFLWRTTRKLPEKGKLGVFNRSYYEEVLTVKVHPEFLNAQYPAGVPDLEQLWQNRYEAIRAHEAHLAASGTLVLKFWLDVSRKEQARRFLSRIQVPEKQWKFSARDVTESGFRDDYDRAVVDMINETSRPNAPWFVIPADNKHYMRWQIAEIMHQALAGLNPGYPQQDEEDRKVLADYETRLTDYLSK